MASERLHDRKYDFTRSRQDGISFDIVEKAVGVRFLVRVETVEIHDLEERFVRQPRHRKIVYLCPGGIRQILDLKLERLFLELICPQRIDVFHHQSPRGE